MSAKADAEAAAALREERQSGSLSLEERKMVARVCERILCLHIAQNDVFEARVDGVRASLDTSSKLRAFSLANYKRKCVNVSLFGMADTFTHFTGNKPAVRTATRRHSPFHRFLCARIRARRHLHRPARPRHHPLHLHRRHRPLRFMLTCARSRCMHSWRGGAMPPELPRRLVCCVRLWRCSLDATWWVPSQHGRARVGLRRRSHTR
jgi:hypothetical protein